MNTTTNTSAAELLTTAETAALLGLQPSTLAGWRHEKYGPPWLTLGSRTVRYRRGSVRHWMRARRVVVK